MLTVREAMKTGGLSKCRLLAGEAGACKTHSLGGSIGVARN